MADMIVTVASYILPLFAIIVLIRCMRSMLGNKSQTEIWGYIHKDDGVALINHWENLIGRSKSADICLPYASVSRVHAVLIRSPKGVWRIFDIFSKGGVWVNGEKVQGVGTVVRDGDVLNLAGNSVRFRDISEKQRDAIEARRTQSWKRVHPAVTLFFLTVFQAILLLEHLCTAESEYTAGILLGFVLLVLLEWFCYFAMRSIRRTGFEVETLAFFLSSIGLSVIASSVPDEMFRQMIIVFAGVVAFFALGWWLRDLSHVKALRWPAAKPSDADGGKGDEEQDALAAEHPVERRRADIDERDLDQVRRLQGECARWTARASRSRRSRFSSARSGWRSARRAGTSG